MLRSIVFVISLALISACTPPGSPGGDVEGGAPGAEPVQLLGVEGTCNATLDLAVVGIPVRVSASVGADEDGEVAGIVDVVTGLMSLRCALSGDRRSCEQRPGVYPFEPEVHRGNPSPSPRGAATTGDEDERGQGRSPDDDDPRGSAGSSE